MTAVRDGCDWPRAAKISRGIRIMTEAHDRFVARQIRRNSASIETKLTKTALVIIDMQEYFLNPQSPFSRCMEQQEPGLLEYFLERSRTTVVPNLKRLLNCFRAHESRVIFTTVASEFADGHDFSPTFQRMNAEARQQIGEVMFPYGLILGRGSPIHWLLSRTRLLSTRRHMGALPQPASTGCFETSESKRW